MWWAPRDDREFGLARAMEQLRGWFREQRFVGAESLSWGYGTAWSRAQGALVPVVLLNEARFPKLFEMIYARSRDDSALLFEPIPLERLDFPDLPRFPNISPPVHGLFVGQPRASSVADDLFDRVLSVRDPIVCGRTGEMGTAGVVVHATGDGERCLLTAGHVFPTGRGSPVRRARWRFLKLRWTEPLGAVIEHVIPSEFAPGWDAAIIRVARRLPLGVRVVPNHMRHFDRQEAVVAYGAFSGLVRNAQTHGGLETLYGEKFQWKNCWMAAPTGILTHGDSGAAVFTRHDRKFLGLYIGQSTVGGQGAQHYVQDSYTLEEEVLKPWNFQF